MAQTKTACIESKIQKTSFISMFYSYSHFLNGVNLSGSGSERPRGMRHLAVLAYQFIALAYSIFPFILEQVGKVLKSKTPLSRKDMGRDGKPGK